jgi:alkylhydroperoxidase/carboxymuconolactone decarboxylase family protein YurZ
MMLRSVEDCVNLMVMLFEEELMAEAPENLPSGAGEIAQAYPAIWAAYAALGKACSEAGPLDERTRGGW